METSPINQFDATIQAILNSDRPDDIKAKQHSLAINCCNTSMMPPKTVESYGDVVMEVLESVPAQSRHKARRLLRLLCENPEVEWNKKGELIYRQTIIPRSHMANLISYALKTAKSPTEKPLGAEEFSKALTSNHVPRNLVPNYNSWKLVTKAQTPQQISAIPPRRRLPAPPPPPITWDEYD